MPRAARFWKNAVRSVCSENCGPITATTAKGMRYGYSAPVRRTGDVSEIREVASLGDGRYRVDFVDMGTEGRRIVKIVDENGAMKIDAVE